MPYICAHDILGGQNSVKWFMALKIILTLLISACCLAYMARPVNSAALEWHSTNIQALRGYNHKIGDPHRTIFTLEHANKWKYGDNYAWIDWIIPDDGHSSYYGEVSPRLSFSRLLNQDLSYGPFQDFLISTTWEKPKHRGPRYLYGGAIDWHIPGFSYFKSNAYLRDDTQLDGSTWQLTFAWKYPFKIGTRDALIEGFSDLAGSEGTSAANQQFVPRFLIDVGDVIKLPEQKLYAGMEWHYWNNKFGAKGANQSAPQLQVKWVF